MAVVVQRMVAADASGVLFTADPVSGHRKVLVIEACFGLGEPLVAGHAAVDRFEVRDDSVRARVIVPKRVATLASPGGGTSTHEVPNERWEEPTLTDEQALRLARLGRRIEAHFGCPQDIEWCRVGDDFVLVQARPLTTLFPIPAAADDAPHVYLSVGHQQMMTDAMPPLGWSMYQHAAGRPMAVAGGRLFVDVTGVLVSPARGGVLAMLDRADPLFASALRTVLDRGDLLPAPPAHAGPPPCAAPPPPAPPTPPPPDVTAVGGRVAACVARSEASLAALARDIEGKRGTALLDFVIGDFGALKQVLHDPESLDLILSGMNAKGWLDEHLATWLGEQGLADALVLSVPGNVTSEMGLALLDVADALRPLPEVVRFLEELCAENRAASPRASGRGVAPTVGDDDLLVRLAALPGGVEARAAIQGWLGRFGARCVGEIDVTRPRWGERPTLLVHLILANLRGHAPGAARARFDAGALAAHDAEAAVLERLRALPDGAHKAAEVKRRIDLVRATAGYREYPKSAMIRRFYVYKRAILAEAARLVAAGVLQVVEDAFYLTLPELRDATQGAPVDPALLTARRRDFRRFQAIHPPRVLTSEGEGLHGALRHGELPADALPGLGVSAGIAEGRARVVRDLAFYQA